MRSVPAVGFVATKPLQIISSMIVARQLGLRPAVLCVVPAFAEAEGVIARLRVADAGFASVCRARHRSIALMSLAMLGAARIFLDSDVGVKTPVAMYLARALRPRLRFSLYEEGLSLIKPHPEERPSNMLVSLGAVPTLGEGRLTDEIWTYSPDAVRARLPEGGCVKRIEPRIEDFVVGLRQLLSVVFWPSLTDDVRRWSGRRCLLYLSSWRVEPRVFDHMAGVDAFTICKFHPHLSGVTTHPRGVDHVVSAAVPAELLLLELLERFDDVEVWHHGTTVAYYVTSSRIRFKHVAEVIGALQIGAS